MADLLTELDVEEISGVDLAANLFKGWLVQKSKGGDTSVVAEEIQELLNKAEELRSNLTKLDEALSAAEPTLSEAPEVVQAAKGVVAAYVKSLLDPQPQPKEKNEEPGWLARQLERFVGGTKKNEVDEDEWKRLCERVATGPSKEE